MNSPQSVKFFQTVPCSFSYEGQQHEVWGLLSHAREQYHGVELHTYEVMTSDLQAYQIWFDIFSETWLVDRLS